MFELVMTKEGLTWAHDVTFDISLSLLFVCHRLIPCYAYSCLYIPRLLSPSGSVVCRPSLHAVTN